MTNISPPKLADALVNLGVPLFVVAGLAEAMGVPVGSASTVVAAALAAALIAPIRHFGERPLARALGSSRGSLHLCIALSAINATIAAIAVHLVRSTLGF